MVAQCALRAGAWGDAECQAGEEHREVRGAAPGRTKAGSACAACVHWARQDAHAPWCPQSLVDNPLVLRFADNQSYIHFVCSEGCRMSYHHPVCYHRLVDVLRQQRPSFKGFKVSCMPPKNYEQLLSV